MRQKPLELDSLDPYVTGWRPSASGKKGPDRALLYMTPSGRGSAQNGGDASGSITILTRDPTVISSGIPRRCMKILTPQRLTNPTSYGGSIPSIGTQTRVHVSSVPIGGSW